MDPTTQAAEDEAWLRERLGSRYLGTREIDPGLWAATVTKRDGKKWHALGNTAAEAVQKMAILVRGMIEQATKTEGR